LLNQSIVEAGLRRKQIVMELVELDASDENFLYKATKELSDNGYMLAIDDYGIDASTIERVRCVKPNIIKIDRSLLLRYENGDFSCLMEALSLARDVNSKTVIEGIETEHQLNLMKKLGFDMYQGYLLAMPQTLEAYQEAKTA
jgi:EAL domain-containing protein (putative c-di-GMP-specific phosphodiesterase class I)